MKVKINNSDEMSVEEAQSKVSDFDKDIWNNKNNLIELGEL